MIEEGRAEASLRQQVEALRSRIAELEAWQSEHKAVEDALRKRYELYRLVLTNAPIMLWAYDRQGIFTLSEGRALVALGRKPGELVGQSVFELNRDVPEIMDARRRALEGEEVTLVTEIRGVVLNTALRPLRDEHGDVIGAIGVATDITQVRRLQEQLIQSDKLAAIGTMVSGVAHEVINPLTGAIGRAELLLRSPLENELRSDVEVIRSEIHRAITTLRDLLYFARAYKPEKSSVSVNAIVESAVALRAYPLRVSGIEVDVELEPGIPNVLADPHQLQQVFLNIIVNAEQAMTEAHGRGSLHLKTRQIGAAIRVTIADDGPGIPVEYLSRIFDPFFTTKPVGQGTGLGLSISYGIIKELGGEFRVASEVGKGAMFTIELPIVPEAPSGKVEGQQG